MIPEDLEAYVNNIPDIYAKRASWQIRRLLRKRDGNLCWICGLTVSENFPLYHRFSATIDHIQERSRYGSDDLYNLALAHYICNQLRSARSAFDRLLILVEHTVYNFQFLYKSNPKRPTMGNFDLDREIQKIFPSNIRYSLCYVGYKKLVGEPLSDYDINYLFEFLHIESIGTPEYEYAYNILSSLEIPEYLKYKARSVFYRHLNNVDGLRNYMYYSTFQNLDLKEIFKYCKNINYLHCFISYVNTKHIGASNRAEYIMFCLTEIAKCEERINNLSVTEEWIWFNCLRILRNCQYSNFESIFKRALPVFTKSSFRRNQLKEQFGFEDEDNR